MERYVVKFVIKVAPGHLWGKRRSVLWEDRQEWGKIAFVFTVIEPDGQNPMP